MFGGKKSGPPAALKKLAAVESEPGAGDTKAKQIQHNLGDSASLKRAVDDLAAEVVTSQGYREDHRVTDVKIAFGIITCTFALVAQFYPRKYPDNWWILLFCVLGYGVCSSLMNLYIYYREGEAFLFTYPKKGTQQGNSGLRLVSRLPRFSETYTLEISDVDSTPARNDTETVRWENSIGRYFDVDGYIVEDHVRQDVARLLQQHEDKRKTKAS